MHKGFLKTAAVLGAITIALGAFGAHTLKEAHVTDDALRIFETAVRYQFYHVFALFIAAILYKEFPSKLTVWAGRLFILGIILFSGSLYIMTWLKAAVRPGEDMVGPVTPIGGLAFIVGWLCLAIAVFRKK